MSINFHGQLSNQIHFIRNSCLAYDAGMVAEGVRIATALRVMFHQTKRSTSLLTHLGSPAILLLSTCATAKPKQAFFPAMCNIELDPRNKRMEYVPKLHVDYERPVPFNTWWWNEIVYLANPMRSKINRRDLVLGAANQDGGAHVDSVLEPRYEKVLQGLGWAMTVHPDGEPSEHIPCKHGHLAALRQMGYEVLNSPDLLGLI